MLWPRKLSLTRNLLPELEEQIMKITPNRRTILGGLVTVPVLGAAARAAEGDEEAPNVGYVEEFVYGDENAPLTVVEYLSYSCGACGAFHIHVWPEVKKNYVDTGKVKFVMRAFLRNQADLFADMVARCGGEKGYYPITDVFLSTQSTWTREADILGSVRQVGRRVGLSAGQLDACFADLPGCFSAGGDALDCLRANPYAYALFEKFQTEADLHKVDSTPTFIIGDEKHTGVSPYEEFAALLDEQLS
jgi:protein-disulfide isomerase